MKKNLTHFCKYRMILVLLFLTIFFHVNGQSCPAPTFSPSSGLVGASVVITGNNFTGATAVKFNGTTASYTVNSATQITATVPSGATPGPISVVTPTCSTVVSSTNFIVCIVYSFSPTSGLVGSTVTLTGNCSTFTGATAVTFNGTAASSYTVGGTGSSITVTVPTGATPGPIAVTTPSGTMTSSTNFIVCIVYSFSPSSGLVGSTVTLTGNCNSFTGATAVTFNGTAASSYVVGGTGGSITATVPSGATTGLIAVTTPSGTMTSQTNFTVISCNGHTYTYSSKWGSTGTGNGQFGSGGPSGLAVDASGNLYINDPSNARVEKFSSAGTYISQFGSAGTGNGQFDGNVDIAIDASGNIYVVEFTNNRVQKFNSSGTYVTKWGSSGTGNGQFDSPSHIAVDASGNVYVADEGNNRIQKFNSSGTYTTQWGSSGTGNGQFNGPGSMAIDASGNVYVADGLNSRVQKFSNTGTYLSQFGSSGSGNGQFTYVGEIAIDGSGNIYVGDNNFGLGARVQKFNSSGTYVTQFGSYGTGNGQFDSVGSIWVDAFCNAYVLDEGNARVQVFSLTQGSRLSSNEDNTDVLNATSLQVYPNPSQGQFNVLLPGKSNYELILYNAMGEEVLRSISVNENYVISDAFLSEGMYVLHTISNGEIHKVKLMITK